MTTEPRVNAFRLEPAMARRRWQDGKHERILDHHFLDFVIDGRPLREAAAELEMVTPLSRPWLEEVPSELDRLLGQGQSEDLSAVRVSLLICPVDGDLACGALTARLEISDDHVTWTDWLWESTQGALPVEQLGRPAVFDRHAYEESLRTALAVVRAMPVDDLALHGKRFLWPWEWGWRLPPPGS